MATTAGCPGPRAVVVLAVVVAVVAILDVVDVVAVVGTATIADRSHYHRGHDRDLGPSHGSGGMQPP
jgi:hypothetical protein